jgi:hypothetical protein
MSLPPLPPNRSNWSPNVFHAQQKLHDIYRSAVNVLSLPTIDPRRVKYHLQLISQDAVPIVVALYEASTNDVQLQRWANKCADKFAAACMQLVEAGTQQCVF